ncbi:MAG: G-D-S-L family lipolytic protein [Saprospiraceae bacterium]|nr:G-D-S-L family lipolytic protein [Saprospiraceae bacterium]
MRLLSFGLLLLVIPALLSAGLMKKQKVVFFGDSITQAGVAPGGYIDLLNQKIGADGLRDQYELIGAGIGGNKVYDLYLRLDDDVLAHNPDVVVIWVGVNDVWHKKTFGTGTDPDKFERFYTALIQKIQSRGIKVVCATPAVVGERTDCSNELDGDLNRYAQIIRQLAARYNCPLADFRQAFLRYNLEHNPDNRDTGILTTDGVHLNADGNQLVANLLYPILLR